MRLSVSMDFNTCTYSLFGEEEMTESSALFIRSRHGMVPNSDKPFLELIMLSTYTDVRLAYIELSAAILYLSDWAYGVTL